jgi:TM2 domain-containing membrane protein YozV
LQPPQPYSYPQPAQLYVRRKEPGVALLLSFFMPGLGQIYNGDVGKGIIFFISFWILVWVFIGWIIWIWALVDAHQSATNINMGRRV